MTPYVLRRQGREEYSVPLPELGPVLRSTYGVLVFQEQVLEIACVVAGFSLAEGDQIRRAMTRDRGPGAMKALREEFVSRAVSRGVPRATAREVFSWTEGFAAYGFSAAHAASFAELAYASAYMRAHFPAEYLAAVLNAQPMGFDSPARASQRGAQDQALGIARGHPPLRRGLHRRGRRHRPSRGPQVRQRALREGPLFHPR